MQTDRLMQHLGSQFTELSSRLMSPGGGIDPDRVVRFAAMGVPETNHCGLTVMRSGHKPYTMSSTDELSLAVDRIQYSLGEGPCLDAADSETAEVAAHLDEDERWPRFGPRCVEETGIVSMLSVRLAVLGHDQAAINFYSRRADAFGGIEVAAASIFAPFAALAVEHRLREQDAQNFAAALTSSRQIGTAMGILMAQRKISSDEAFVLLRTASQHLNRKLRDVAAEVAETGELPSRGAATGPTGRADGTASQEDTAPRVAEGGGVRGPA